MEKQDQEQTKKDLKRQLDDLLRIKNSMDVVLDNVNKLEKTLSKKNK